MLINPKFDIVSSISNSSIVSMFGIMLVGNFQFVNISTVYFLGATLAFVGIIILEFLVATLFKRARLLLALVISRYTIGVLATISLIMSKLDRKSTGSK